MADRTSLDSSLSGNDDSEMAPLNPTTTTVEDLASPSPAARLPLNHSNEPCKLYKRRFIGLFVLVMLNIIVSWDWLTFSAVSSTAAQFFKVSESAINWLSTGFLFAFIVASPFTIWALHRGPKTSIVISALLLFLGNWIRYAGSRAGSHGNFPLVIVGQILIGFAQPFVLAA
ncbi:hypothetical protein KCU73_g13605, partial [Aureobasidium melanogenum]